MMNPQNRQEELLRKIQAADFAAHECVLYLDNHPGNRKALERHAAAVQAGSTLKEQYEKTYGSLSCSGAGKNGSWDWVKGSWPWQLPEG